LWKQQANDGGWPSHTYGLLRSGQSLTPFVLEALLQIPNQPVDKIDRAIEFIRKNTNPDGALGMMDPTLPDYPNYATALAVSAICRAKRPGWQQQIAPMIAYLRRMQFTESTGWKQSDPPYGAWGMGGIDHPPPNPGHVDLSMSRYVIEALRAAGVQAEDPAFTRARIVLILLKKSCGSACILAIIDGDLLIDAVLCVEDVPCRSLRGKTGCGEENGESHHDKRDVFSGDAQDGKTNGAEGGEPCSVRDQDSIEPKMGDK